MSVKKVNETTAQKILNSDIYDITRFVDDIKKQKMDGIDDGKETLLVGMYGYLGYQFSSLLQNAIVTASELSNEAIPTRAKFDRNVITHALSLGVEKVAATPANMRVLLMFPEKALQANMIDGEFTLTADTPLKFDEFEFHTDYDITIKYANLTDSTNGSQRNYVYTATYDMTHKNPISDIENPFLPPISIFKYEEDNMIVLPTNLHQVYYRKIFEKIITDDIISNKTINFSFEKQMSHFNIIVSEPNTESNPGGKVYLNAVYDGLYNQEIAGQKYCYYQYINPNTIRIRFDPTNYQPPVNSDIIIECYTTDGASGNFEYSEEKTIRLTSDKYTNLYCIVAQRDDYGSCGGLDRQSIEQLQHIIPKEALSRGSITTLTDLRNFFNSLNNENSVLHVFRKEDNILDRVYYVYNLMKDSDRNIVPTNTIPIYVESTRRDNNNGKIYIESGTPFFHYKFGEGANLPVLRDNYVGYLQQKVSNVEKVYSFCNDNALTTYQGTPTKETLEEWFEKYRTSFDADKVMDNFKYELGKEKPSEAYDFFENCSVCFKPFYFTNDDSRPSNPEPTDKSLYDNWFYGTCRDCNLWHNMIDIQQLAEKMYKGKDYHNDILDLEIEWCEKEGYTTTMVYFPRKNISDLNPAKVTVQEYNGSTLVDVQSDVNINNPAKPYLSINLIRTLDITDGEMVIEPSATINVYTSSNSEVPFETLTGRALYVYDIKMLRNGRIPVTLNRSNAGKTPADNYIYGWIYVSNIPKGPETKYKYTISNIDINRDEYDAISSVNFYRNRVFNYSGEVIDTTNTYMQPIIFDKVFNDEGTLIDVRLSIYAWTVNIVFNDETLKFAIGPGAKGTNYAVRRFFVPDYIADLRAMTSDNKKLYAKLFLLNFLRPVPDEYYDTLILDSINTIDVYSYDGQGKYGFESLTLAEGDLIRFSTYDKIHKDDFIYKDPSTWTLAEVLSVEKNDGKIISVELLIKDEKTENFIHDRYTLPFKDRRTQSYNISGDNVIALISKITKFLYTNPLSIVLKDDPNINSHRITASYYLDIIDETRYQMFDCINSKSPIQYILPYIKTKRTSYLSENRYKYTIKLNVKPNTGSIDLDMINRTQVIAVFYKKDSKDSKVSRPIMYSIAKYTGGNNGEHIQDDGIPFEFNLYTRPFTTSTKHDEELNRSDIIDDHNDVYIGPMEYINELGDITSDEAKREFWENYRCFWTTANISQARPKDFVASDIDLTKCGSGIATNNNGYAYYADTLYLNLNTEMKIFIMYKYDTISTKTLTDGLTAEYLTVDNTKPDSLYNSVPQTTMFNPHVKVDEPNVTGYVEPYSLKQMVLTNVYSTYEGINLLHDYSNIMNSYVTSIKTNDIFSPENDSIESYIVNRVPCVRYFYWWNEERVVEFITEMKKKINYVLDAIAPLECTFGLDYKFFNTYGPSNMYHLTDDDGEVEELIDNVALTMTFRAKFYNEDSDALSIRDKIKDSIKDYLENLDQLDDIHFPNITTMIETQFAEYLIYFEFVSFNIYDATTQHVISVENMEMLSMVPEFLHVDTNDYNGLPYINIRLVT